MNITALISVPGRTCLLSWALISDRASSPFLRFLYKNYFGYSTITLPHKFHNQLDKLQLRNPVGMFGRTAINLHICLGGFGRKNSAKPSSPRTVSLLPSSIFFYVLHQSFTAFAIEILHICLLKLIILSSANNEDTASLFPISFILLPGKFTHGWRSEKVWISSQMLSCNVV